MNTDSYSYPYEKPEDETGFPGEVRLNILKRCLTLFFRINRSWSIVIHTIFRRNREVHLLLARANMRVSSGHGVTKHVYIHVAIHPCHANHNSVRSRWVDMAIVRFYMI